MQVSLARIDAFKAITTLSVDGHQTSPFTLEVDKIPEQPNGDKIAAMVEQNSIETLVKPYQHLRALTRKEITYLLNHSKSKTSEPPSNEETTDSKEDSGEEEELEFDVSSSNAGNDDEIDFLTRWKNKRTEVLKGSSRMGGGSSD